MFKRCHKARQIAKKQNCNKSTLDYDTGEGIVSGGTGKDYNFPLGLVTVGDTWYWSAKYEAEVLGYPPCPQAADYLRKHPEGIEYIRPNVPGMIHDRTRAYRSKVQARRRATDRDAKVTR